MQESIEICKYLSDRMMKGHTASIGYRRMIRRSSAPNHPDDRPNSSTSTYAPRSPPRPARIHAPCTPAKRGLNASIHAPSGDEGRVPGAYMLSHRSSSKGEGEIEASCWRSTLSSAGNEQVY